MYGTPAVTPHGKSNHALVGTGYLRATRTPDFDESGHDRVPVQKRSIVSIFALAGQSATAAATESLLRPMTSREWACHCNTTLRISQFRVKIRGLSRPSRHEPRPAMHGKSSFGFSKTSKNVIGIPTPRRGFTGSKIRGSSRTQCTEPLQ